MRQLSYRFYTFWRANTALLAGFATHRNALTHLTPATMPRKHPFFDTSKYQPNRRYRHPESSTRRTHDYSPSVSIDDDASPTVAVEARDEGARTAGTSEREAPSLPELLMVVRPGREALELERTGWT